VPERISEDRTAAEKQAAQSGSPNGRGLMASNPMANLQRTIGNEAVTRLLESGIVQAKLRVSQPGDPDEQEADHIADKIVSAQHAPTLQRKCSCSGSASCSKCAHQEDELIHRKPATAALRSFPLSLQRAPADQPTTQSGSAQSTTSTQSNPSTTSAGVTPTSSADRAHALIVEDDTPFLAPGQMQKTQFITLLESSASVTADAALASVGKKMKASPYVKRWLAPYRHKNAQHLMRAMHKYAPETMHAGTAYEAVALVDRRVQRATLSWAKTGTVSGLPEGIQEEAEGGGGFFGAISSFASSGFGSALLGFLGGGKSDSEGGGVQRKAQDGASAPAHDAGTVQGQLGSGHPLDTRVQSQMSSAFGYDFSGVRVHTDSRAGELSSQLNARAFTIGSNVAFASGEYQPGTLIGDALIAHELAHVVQQGGGKSANGVMSKDAALADDSSLEHDADHSAVAAVLSTWTGAKRGLQDIGANALPRLKSGLKLQKCSCHKNVPVKTPTSPATPVKTTAPATPAPAAPPAKVVDPEKSFFFEDPSIQPMENEGSDVDFSKGGSQGGELTTSAQTRHQVVVDKPGQFSTVNAEVPVVIRFAYPLSEFASGKESSNLKSAKGSVIKAVAEIFSDLGTFDYKDKADEQRILKERARLREVLKGFTQESPLNIYLAGETEEETMSGEFFPVTARVFVNLKDVGDPAKLKTAIRVPLHHILGGANPAKGKPDDPASSTEVKKTALHESIHVFLIGHSADSDSEWNKVQGQLKISGPDKVKQQATDLVHSYLLAQEELFAYTNVELLYPMGAGDKAEAKDAYAMYKKTVEDFFKRHGIKLKSEDIKLVVTKEVKGRTVEDKTVPWQITYTYPTQISLTDADAETLAFILKLWPLRSSRPVTK
jgi:hypothetical protein